ncbi:AMP-binding protein [Actinomadura madurae]|uniref:Cyclohexanecarboxylate-CoA ligase n=1 Tax=Actinomadura madurae TaxID=1993 RepID=A0A1I5KQQ1_9ACTN|nr:AMP-binding protein [Actinomadura madurae]SFO87424.1 cyclohexanecarboxylate-CoA ligase [Actinomadura madurae]SPT49892.1 Short-chain-fatty-acid--CoA ligase [Actinomadura madurae]
MTTLPEPAPHDRADRYRRQGWWPGEALVARFRRQVEADPEAISVRDDRGAVLTRAGLWHAAGRFAGLLASRGVGRGDVVVQCLPNAVAWQVIFLGCLRLGAVPATIPVTTDPGTLRYVADLVAARALVTDRTYSGGTDDGVALRVAAESAHVVTAVTVDADAGSAPEPAMVLRDVASGAGPPASPPHAAGLAQLMFTSSTTGRPKAVAHTEDTLAAVNIGFAERFGLTSATPIFMASPLGHSVGAWHGARLSLFTGAELVLQERWDPERALRVIDRHGCAFTAAATPFLKDLMDLPWKGPKMAGLRTFLCGGAPVPPALLEEAAAQAPGTFVTVLWGMTEGGVTTCLPGDPPERITGTAGTGLPELELRILDDTGAWAAPGAEGELAMRGPGVFTGYAGQPEMYHELITEDGFFRTGDLARLDGDGYLHLTGRLKDLIIRGGVNISPIPLENALSEHPAVRAVAVIGTPDARLGERICAVVEPAGEPPTLDAFLHWLDERGVPRRLWPERLRLVDGMPRTAAGKIRKADLRERMAKEPT